MSDSTPVEAEAARELVARLFPRAKNAHFVNRLVAVVTTREAALRVRIAELEGALRNLRRMASDPMKSWDSGRVIDAQRVDEICEEALETKP